MNINTIQKRKFLNNIYKLFYSTGKKPSDSEIIQAFNQYFSYNNFDEPVKLDINKLLVTNTVDGNIINELMINTLLNIEVLYDCIMENNEQVFSVVTALNSKIDNLRAKRKELESKIDQLIFANSNSDGFFYSYLENFASTEKIDLTKTTAFVDTINNNVTIPKITSEISNQITVNNVNSSNIKSSISYNGRLVNGNVPVNNFDLVFDGLNDTYWSYEYQAVAPGIVSMTFDIPINTSFTISKIEGSLISETPCSIFIKANPANANDSEVIKEKNSKEDFNRFSFILPNTAYSTISITLYKSEPDRVIQHPTNPYSYSFGIRELSIGSSYYDDQASLISLPISVPTTDNSLLGISAVSLEARQQVVSGTKLSYYVAQDIENATNIYDFNWIPIEPSNINNESSPKIVNLIDSVYKYEYIDQVSENLNYDYEIIPLRSDTTALNQLNPIVLPYSERTVHRIAYLNEDKKYLQPYILSGLNNFQSYWISNLANRYSLSTVSSLQGWADIISVKDNIELRKDIITNYDSSFTTSSPGACAELLETKLLVEDEFSVSHTISKIGSFTLTVYLNGSVIADLPAGQSSSNIEWSFVRGINTISIMYDNQTSTNVTFDLMVGARLSNYGTVFLDYFSYLDPIEFRRSVEDNVNVFTIDNVYGSKQILASKYISKRSILKYYSDTTQLISAVRYRVDFNRFTNPLQTPVLDGIRIKFKHNDIQ